MAKKLICHKGFEIQVLRSGAGYYIGTVDSEDGSPYCRLSVNYYPTAAAAQKDLDSLSFEDRAYADEIRFCNEGRGCLQSIPPLFSLSVSSFFLLKNVLTDTYPVWFFWELSLVLACLVVLTIQPYPVWLLWGLSRFCSGWSVAPIIWFWFSPII